MLEVLAIARAQVKARGGSALLGYRIKELVLNHNAQKNQGQCLLTMTGDVVDVVASPAHCQALGQPHEARVDSFSTPYRRLARLTTSTGTPFGDVSL